MCRCPFRLVSFNRITLNGRTITLPYKDTKLHYVIRKVSRQMLRLETWQGFDLLWDGLSRVQLKLSKSYRNKVSGLCGNFNDNAADDLMSPQAEKVRNVIAFANSWKTNANCKARTREVYRGACAQSSQFERMATKMCQALSNDPAFNRCQNRVSATSYIEQCMHDMCSCGARRNSNMKHCECTAFASYARACALEGKILNWRTASRCREYKKAL